MTVIDSKFKDREAELISLKKKVKDQKDLGSIDTDLIDAEMNGAESTRMEKKTKTQELLETLCEKPLIEKNRYRIPFGGFVWEVDEFFGENCAGFGGAYCLLLVLPPQKEKGQTG